MILTKQQLKERLAGAESGWAAKQEQDAHRLKFHLMPPVGWLNDPNGLCQKDGVYHVYFQYSPFDANGGLKLWGHYTSNDLLHWRYEGAPLLPDSACDRDGVYSGSALVDGGRMHICYTGNVKQEGDFDYIRAGREANQIYVSSDDGIHFTEKECVLRREDYPEDYSCHIRDPKLFQDGDSFYMLLGGRKLDDRGAVLLYSSRDMKCWEYMRELSTEQAFGYMWECPDYFVLDGKEILSVSPQGLQRGAYRCQNVYQSGYFPVEDFLDGGNLCGEFTEWDMGFDFYAPQTFMDETGRRILIGWAGMPDAEEEYKNPTAETSGWQHALTVPRELTWRQGRLCQYPVEEIQDLRDERHDLKSGECITLEQGIFDLEMTGIGDGPCRVEIKDGLLLKWEDGVLSLIPDKDAGAGRTVRRAKVPALESLRVLADTSLVEIYANQGGTVMTTRYYPKEKAARLEISCSGSKNTVWKLNTD